MCAIPNQQSVQAEVDRHQADRLHRMSVLQRRLASSLGAIRSSLRKRADRISARLIELEALRAGLEGSVLLQVTVDAEGAPIHVAIARSSGHHELDIAARRQVQSRWRFKPALQDGHPVQAIGLVPIDFRLH